MQAASKDIPEFIKALFRDGTLKVDSRGRVWRCKTRYGRPVDGAADAVSRPVEPRRIDRPCEVGGGARIAIKHHGKLYSVGITKIRRYFGLDGDEE